VIGNLALALHHLWLGNMKLCGGWSRQHGKPSAKDNGKQESHPSRATHRSPPSQALRVSANATEKSEMYRQSPEYPATT
jgi:hypothetical protein